jgi:hypothetical protein
MIFLSAESPSWTDILQALGAVIAIPLTLITVYKLVKKDKERESKIKSLSTIAIQLTEMQIEAEKRYKSSKKPHISIVCDANIERKYVRLDFVNTNMNTTIVNFRISNDLTNFKEFTASISSINDINGTQQFWLALSFKGEPFEYAALHLDYTTEEGYLFIQDILIWFERGKYVFSPSAIIDKQNSPIT